MANTVVIGMQWGDEGKGKIVDLLCPAFDIVARYQGGNNAGHTVKFGDEHFALHLIPSGILHGETRCVLGNGMVIHPEAFFSEVEGLEARGISVAGRLFIASRAHVLLPHYMDLDRSREAAMGKSSIGTTFRGIGPAYEIKAARHGLRMGDLCAEGLEERLELQLARLGSELSSAEGGKGPDIGAIADYCRQWGERLEPYLRDTDLLLDTAMTAGEGVLFEGAQGTLLDVDHGTYPFVTSSNSTAGGAAVGTGVAPTRIDGAIGVLKAYTTRVGKGPFVTELDDAQGEYLRDRGHEFGTTTGRPRRCGWLDLVAARYARRLNGIESIALTKLDVLDGLDEVRLCVAYRIDGREVREMPSRADEFARAEPIYETVEGWRDPTEGVLEYEALPAAARSYIERVEREVGAGVGLVSTGPKREETLAREDSGLSKLTSGRL